MQVHRVALLVIAILSCPTIAVGQGNTRRFEATVIYVSDGDTCRVRDRDGHQYRIRLFGIDAPESHQPAGQTARQVLDSIVGQGTIQVRLTGARTYGRYVARIFVDGMNVNEEMVRDGWAWHYDRYTEGDEADRLTESEEDARAERTGLWADDNPIRPECWRRGDRDGDCQPDPDVFRITNLPTFSRAPHTARPTRSPRRTSVRTATDRQRENLSPVDKFKFFMRSGSETTTSTEAIGARQSSQRDQFIYGRPVEHDGRFRFVPPGGTQEVRGITELTRIAFTVGHNDKYRLPAWVAMKWTRDDFDRGRGVALPRPAPSVDEELPVCARGGTSFQYSETGLQRGHMARDDDMESWGADAVAEATKMSNFVPQLQGRNHAVWSFLEDAHKQIVADDDDEFEISTIWIIAGPVFYSSSPSRSVGQPGTGVPDATYKIIAWKNSSGDFTARAYLINQLDNNTDLWEYLVSVDELEDLTGLDFFPELDEDVETSIEQIEFDTLWE